ncbi:MAG: cupin domain-containing protein [Deltaproteobacteria bacterium]|nr:cupin domain-containing protein [Deltaproteobacteria bacterium]MBN2671471.1 cupin domain-containing protein [Deltaproteobacteria bacterium]
MQKESIDTPIIVHVNDVPSSDVPRSPGATIQVMLGNKENMPRFHTRIFTLQPGTVIPAHQHDVIEHEQVMLEGTMKLTVGGVEHVVTAGNVMYLPAGVPHSYENIGEEIVRFVCCIPAKLPYSTDFTD